MSDSGRRTETMDYQPMMPGEAEAYEERAASQTGGKGPPDDTCPKCGYHQCTKDDRLYRCDKCGVSYWIHPTGPLAGQKVTVTDADLSRPPVVTVKPKETVDHPDHYGGKDDPFEAVKVIEAWGLGFHLGNAVKYICRRGTKGDLIEDLKKARWYLDREIERVQRTRDNP